MGKTHQADCVHVRTHAVTVQLILLWIDATGYNTVVLHEFLPSGEDNHYYNNQKRLFA